jgi:exopolysaccharide biosynthesis polyprenyl glycosylphosphotransferase
LRFQLGGVLIFGVLLPAFVLGAFSDTNSLGYALNQNTIAAAFGAVISLYLIRNMSLFPGTNAGYFVLPCTIMGFGIVLFLLFLFRIDYGRAPLLTSVVTTAIWLYAVEFVMNRRRRGRIGLVVAGDTADLRNTGRIDVIELAIPSLSTVEVDAIIADFRHDHSDEWESFLADCALRGIPVFHVKQFRESLTGRVEIEHLSENSFGSLVPFMAYLRLRRSLDLIAALAAGLVLLPVLILVAILIRLDSSGPSLFRQTRIGYRGKPFTVFKFRTMHTNRTSKDALEEAVTQDNDARITKFGRFLRKTRIDELPQILNILRGEMSWIGPRPEAEVLSRWYERELPYYRYRHIVPPGITGWAQVNQGHVADLERVNYKLHYDFYYIKNFSPWLDSLIVAKTIQTMITGMGSR